MAEFTFLNPYWLLGWLVIPVVLALNNQYRTKKSSLIAPHLAKMLGHSVKTKHYFAIWGEHGLSLVLLWQVQVGNPTLARALN